MGEMKHTPGPWRVDEEADEFVIVGRPEWPCRRNGISGEWDVATVADLGFDHDEAGPEALANARLIAAAPDLRLAAQEALDTITDYLAYEHDGDPYREDARLMGEMDINSFATDGRLERLRAALSKAEGRSLSSASGQEGGE